MFMSFNKVGGKRTEEFWWLGVPRSPKFHICGISFLYVCVENVFCPVCRYYTIYQQSVVPSAFPVRTYCPNRCDSSSVMLARYVALLYCNS